MRMRGARSYVRVSPVVESPLVALTGQVAQWCRGVAADPVRLHRWRASTRCG